MPRVSALRKQADIRLVFDEGEVRKFPSFYLYYLKNNQALNRVAFIVSKKVSRLAVRRNRYRRLLRQLWKSWRATGWHSTYDMVVVARPSITSVSGLGDLEEEAVPLKELSL